MTIYRTLDSNEAREFRQYAQDNWHPNQPVNPVWHPIIKEECERLQRRHNCNEALKTLDWNHVLDPVDYNRINEAIERRFASPDPEDRCPTCGNRNRLCRC